MVRLRSAAGTRWVDYRQGRNWGDGKVVPCTAMSQ